MNERTITVETRQAPSNERTITVFGIEQVDGKRWPYLFETPRAARKFALTELKFDKWSTLIKHTGVRLIEGIGTLR